MNTSRETLHFILSNGKGDLRVKIPLTEASVCGYANSLEKSEQHARGFLRENHLPRLAQELCHTFPVIHNGLCSSTVSQNESIHLLLVRYLVNITKIQKQYVKSVGLDWRKLKLRIHSYQYLRLNYY